MSLISVIPSWLAFDVAAPFDSLQIVHKSYLRACYSALCDHRDWALHRLLLDRLEELSPERAATYLCAPSTVAVLNEAGASCGPLIARELLNPLVAELAVLGDAAVEECSCKDEVLWTSLGDFKVVKRDSASIGLHAFGTFIDGVSVHNFFDHALQDNEYLVYECDAVHAMRSRLCDALAQISGDVPAAGKLISAFVRSIVFQRHARDRRMFSGSRRGLRGKVGVLNPDAGDQFTIMEALVHEAVHALLYVVEILQPFYVDVQQPIQPLIRSPWTQRLLPPHSLTHACFVWYALASFWQSCSGPADIVQSYRARALRGFASLCLSQTLQGIVNESVLAAIDAVQRRLTEQVGC